MYYKDVGSRRGVGARKLHSPNSKCGPEHRSRKPTMNFLTQFQQYALTIDKHLKCIITKYIHVLS